jgi:photosynthetic reaction center cytochrome c subunit
MSSMFRITSVTVAIGLAALVAGCERPPQLTSQNGFRGTGMDQINHPATVAKLVAANQVPPPPYPLEPDTGGQRANEAYANVTVLGDLSADEFNRLMASITEWVSPAEGCNYCHNPENMASDEIYTKVVARRMIQMTRNINTNWVPHFNAKPGAGVTCWTCHRGNAVPVYHWSFDPKGVPMETITNNRHGQNAPLSEAAMTALPSDPFTPFLFNANQIRVAANSAFPSSHVASIAATEATYGLMNHISTALGVNCTYCHNAQSFRNWATSTPQRTTAWYGIRMVRELNNDYMQPLTGVLPANRVGPLGDPFKVNCATCHQGVAKPMYGVPMLKDHPALAGVRAPVKAAAAPAVAANAVASPVEPVATVDVAPATTPAATQ